MDASMRTLSSAQTFLMKVVFPVVWITGFGLGTLVLWVGAMHGSNGESPPYNDKWWFLIAWIAGSTFLLWGCARLKKVRMGGGHLYVSNYWREIKVPVAAIASVTENRWTNIHPVTIHFRVRTEFGQRIIFMPSVRLLPWASHPVVQELLEAAEEGGAHVV